MNQEREHDGIVRQAAELELFAPPGTAGCMRWGLCE